jgi:hypothetical protein
LGVRCTATSIGGAQTQRDVAPPFSLHRSPVLGVYVVVVAGLARRTGSHSIRNGPPLAPSRYRFDSEISITWSLARWRPRIALETRQLIREMARANFLWGAPRIHGELLKLGITVSQASIAIYAAVAEKPSLTGVADLHKTPRDHHCPKRWAQRVSLDSWSPFSGPVAIASLLVSPFSICRCSGHRSVVLGCLAYAQSTPPCRSSSSCSLYQNRNSDYQIHGARVSAQASSSQGRRTAHQCAQLAGACLLRLRRHSTATSTNCLYSQTAIGRHRIAIPDQ